MVFFFIVFSDDPDAAENEVDDDESCPDVGRKIIDRPGFMNVFCDDDGEDAVEEPVDESEDADAEEVLKNRDKGSGFIW